MGDFTDDLKDALIQGFLAGEKVGAATSKKKRKELLDEVITEIEENLDIQFSHMDGTGLTEEMYEEAKKAYLDTIREASETEEEEDGAVIARLPIAVAMIGK